MTETTGARPQEGAWLIVALLFFFMLINFVDKAVFGLSGVEMMKEMQLTPQQFGAVGSAFFFLFSISAIITGFIVNRIEARWALLVMSLIWALTQFPIIGTANLATLYVCRIVLGAGEGPAYPVAIHAAFKWFPNEKRVLPTAIIAQGASIGVVLALPFLDWIIEHISWHWAFGVLGFIGLGWCVAWYFLGAEGTLPATIEASNGKTVERVSYMHLIFNSTTLSGFAAGFGAYWGLSLLVAWFTPYLMQGLGYSQYAASWISTLPWAVGPFIVVGCGWLSQRMLARGATTRVARGILGGGCVAFGGVTLIAMPFMPGDPLKIACMVIGLAVPSVIYVMGHPIVSEFTPVPQRAAMLAINNAVATSAGLLGPYVTGSVVQSAASKVEGYHYGFMICGVVALVGGVLGMVFLRPQTEIERFVHGEPAASGAPVAAE
jgi:MFS transporter, ACS family, D-galactonate transporter